MNPRSLFLPAIFIGSTALRAADPALESVLRRAYDAVVRGDTRALLASCHPDNRRFRGAFDEQGGYSPGRSASLGELWNLAGMVADRESVHIHHLKIEVVRIEGDRAIAWARYHASTERPSSLESSRARLFREEWDAQDYIVLKKHNGEWRLRRLEDRAGHFLALASQGPKSDPWGGVK